MCVAPAAHEHDETSMAVDVAMDNVEEATHTEIDSGGLTHGVSEDKGVAASAIKSLNKLEKNDRKRRRVTDYSSAEQGADEFIKELLLHHPDLVINQVASGKVEKRKVRSSSSNVACASAPIEISGGEAVGLSQKAAASSSSIKGVMNYQHLPFKDRPILVYGFKGLQSAMMRQFGDLGFTDRRTMFIYNKVIKLNFSLDGRLGFKDYCTFLSDAKIEATASSLHPLLKPLASEAKAASSKVTSVPLPPNQLAPWASYLSKNIGIFNFYNQLETKEKRMHFLFKNYTDIESPDKIRELSEHAQNLIKMEQWRELADHFAPAFDLLASASHGTQSNKDLIDQYDDLLSDDNKAGLDCLVDCAFFRKTSKLGESFARDHGITIVSVLQTGNEGGPEAIKTVNQPDPTYFSPPMFYRNPEGAFARKPITYSEIKEAGRIIQRMKPSDPKLRYVLLREIQENKTKATGKPGDASAGTGAGAGAGGGSFKAAATSASRLSSSSSSSF